MEAPVLVLRDDLTETVTAIQLPELFAAMRSARDLVRQMSADPQSKRRAKATAEQVFEVALNPHAPPRVRACAVVAAYLLREALNEAQSARDEKPAVDVQAESVADVCPNTLDPNAPTFHPSDIPCELCAGKRGPTQGRVTT